MFEVDETTNMAELLDSLEPGEELVLTRHGIIVARLVNIAGTDTRHPSSAITADAVAIPTWMAEDLRGR
jgi:antitoxin (DNA-binding transcriptional repressor) of toxin-antitoxin stability system